VGLQLGGIVELNLEPGFSRALGDLRIYIIIIPFILCLTLNIETIPELVDCNLLIKIKEV
jgi:hypothetical protein